MRGMPRSVCWCLVPVLVPVVLVWCSLWVRSMREPPPFHQSSSYITVDHFVCKQSKSQSCVVSHNEETILCLTSIELFLRFLPYAVQQTDGRLSAAECGSLRFKGLPKLPRPLTGWGVKPGLLQWRQGAKSKSVKWGSFSKSCWGVKMVKAGSCSATYQR